MNNLLKRLSLFIVLALVVIKFIPIDKIQAGRLEGAQINLDSLSPSSTLSGFICAEPSTNDTENKLSVQFPSDFTISTDISNWIIGTDNLPNGSSVWPGIGSNPESISGKTVIFTSNNLTVGTQYCFSFSSSQSTTGVVGSKYLTVSTLNSGSGIIDTKQVNIPIISSDKINVTASVAAKSSDLNVKVNKINPTNSTVWQDINVSFRISYSTIYSYPVDAVLVAQWGQGTFESQSTPSIDVVNYIPNTAKQAYGNSIPVIDLINKTITWDISDLPGSKTYNADFDLRIDRPYIGDLYIDFPVIAKLYVISAVKQDTLNLRYKTDYLQLTPPPGPTATPLPSSTPTPTPRFTIGSINVSEISTNSATIYVSFNKKAKPIVSYGTSIGSLDKQVTSLNSEYKQFLKLTDLAPDTEYFFRVRAESESTEKQSVEYYSFRTAKIGDVPKPVDSSLIVSSNNSIIYSKDLGNSELKDTLIVPKNTYYTIQLNIDNSDLIEKAQAKAVSNKVLGINTFSDQTYEINDFEDMAEVSNGVYAVKLLSPNQPELYELMLKTYDYNGAITLTKIANLKVSSPLTVLDPYKNPVEQADVVFKIYNFKTKLYEDLSGNLLSEDKTIKTDAKGMVNEVLPPGKYQVVIKSTGYKDKIVDFELGPNPDLNYPTIILEPTKFSVTTFILYNYETLTHNLGRSLSFLNQISESNRLLMLIDLSVLVIFVISAFLAFFERIKLPLKHSFNYVIHHSKKISSNTKEEFTIKVVDQVKSPVANAHIFVLNGKNKIVDISTTNRQGSARLFVVGKNIDHYKLRIVRKGFSEITHDFNPDLNYEIIKLDSKNKFKPLNILSVFLERSFELILIVSVILEIVFALSLGFGRTLPFLVISFLNLVLFINHQKITDHHF